MAEPTKVPHTNEPVSTANDEERGAIGGTPYSVTSSDSSIFTNIDLSQEALDVESQQKVLVKKEEAGVKTAKKKGELCCLIRILCYWKFLKK